MFHTLYTGTAAARICKVKASRAFHLKLHLTAFTASDRWNKTGYTFFVDGKESWHVDGPVSETEQFILVSTECMGYRTEEEKPCTEVQGSAPDEFVVDYVRVFDEI